MDTTNQINFEIRAHPERRSLLSAASRLVGTIALAGLLNAGAQSAIKWNPGHYAHSDARPMTPGSQSGVQAAAMTQMAQVINTSTGLPGFKGWQGEYP